MPSAWMNTQRPTKKNADLGRGKAGSIRSNTAVGRVQVDTSRSRAGDDGELKVPGEMRPGVESFGAQARVGRYVSEDCEDVDDEGAGAGSPSGKPQRPGKTEPPLRARFMAVPSAELPARRRVVIGSSSGSSLRHFAVRPAGRIVVEIIKPDTRYQTTPVTTPHGAVDTSRLLPGEKERDSPSRSRSGQPVATRRTHVSTSRCVGADSRVYETTARRLRSRLDEQWVGGKCSAEWIQPGTRLESRRDWRTKSQAGSRGGIYIG